MCAKIKETNKKQIPFKDYIILKGIATIQEAGINVYDDGKKEYKTNKLKEKGLIKIGKNNALKITKKGKKYIK